MTCCLRGERACAWAKATPGNCISSIESITTLDARYCCCCTSNHPMICTQRSALEAHQPHFSKTNLKRHFRTAVEKKATMFFYRKLVSSDMYQAVRAGVTRTSRRVEQIKNPHDLRGLAIFIMCSPRSVPGDGLFEAPRTNASTAVAKTLVPAWYKDVTFFTISLQLPRATSTPQHFARLVHKYDCA